VVSFPRQEFARKRSQSTQKMPQRSNLLNLAIIRISLATFCLDIQFRPADPSAVFRRRPKSLDEEAVAADPGRLELLWLLRGEFDDTMFQ
jgi:hypothetical protein